MVMHQGRQSWRKGPWGHGVISLGEISKMTVKEVSRIANGLARCPIWLQTEHRMVATTGKRRLHKGVEGLEGVDEEFEP